MKTKPVMGRPSKSGDTKIYDNPLYRLLVAKLPSAYLDNKGRLNTLKLSKATGFARFTIYCWFGQRPLSREGAQALLKLSENAVESARKGLLTKKDFYPFLGL